MVPLWAWPLFALPSALGFMMPGGGGGLGKGRGSKSKKEGDDWMVIDEVAEKSNSDNSFPRRVAWGLNNDVFFREAGVVMPCLV